MGLHVPNDRRNTAPKEKPSLTTALPVSLEAWEKFENFPRNNFALDWRRWSLGQATDTRAEQKIVGSNPAHFNSVACNLNLCVFE
jgi:hypothetical protein